MEEKQIRYQLFKIDESDVDNIILRHPDTFAIYKELYLSIEDAANDAVKYGTGRFVILPVIRA